MLLFSMGCTIAAVFVGLYRLTLPPTDVQKLDCAGIVIARELAELRDQLFKAIGDCGALRDLKNTIHKIVTDELPRYLAHLRYLLENLPEVRRITAELGKTKEIDQPRLDALGQLEHAPGDMEDLLRNLKVRLQWTFQDVVAFRAGLPNQSAEIRRDQRELNVYLEKIQYSVREARLLTELEDGVFREYAYPVVDENLSPLDSGAGVITTDKVH